MSEVMIQVNREAVPRTFERTEQTVFEKEQQTVVFVREDPVRVFYEVIPNGS
jgi:hypothetical protein